MVDSSFLMLFFALGGFLVGLSFGWILNRNKIIDLLDDLKVHYKVIDDEQHEHLVKRYSKQREPIQIKTAKGIITKVREKRNK